MPRKLTEQEREAFLAEPRIGVVSVASSDGRPPLTVPIWYDYQPGGNITFFTSTQGTRARKARLIEEAGVVSFLVQHDSPPYKYVSVEGTVVGIDRPPAMEQMLAILNRYLPEEMAQGFAQGEIEHPQSELTLFTIRPDRWLTSDFSE